MLEAEKVCPALPCRVGIRPGGRLPIRPPGPPSLNFGVGVGGLRPTCGVRQAGIAHYYSAVGKRSSDVLWILRNDEGLCAEGAKFCSGEDRFLSSAP